MPLLVVPLDPGSVGELTLREWDELSGCKLVLFERSDHPLAPRLEAAGVEVGSVDRQPYPQDDGCAVVLDERSPQILELVRAGARVAVGVAAPDELTAAHGSPVARRASHSLGRLAIVMARLRSADGCPWDQEQTHESLRVHLIEETHEVLEAIDKGAVGEELQEELGDLLLQVAFHAQLAADDDRFDLADVADGIVAKLLHRHPHVFSDTEVSGAADVVRNWEAIKADEKDRSDPFDGIPAELSALLAAYKTQKRAAPLGYDSDEERDRAFVLDKLSVADVGPDELGEALFALVSLARARGVDPEGALRSATERFRSSLRSR